MIFFVDGALTDLERIFDFNQAFDAQFALRQIAMIRRAITILDESPYIGRKASAAVRELVVSTGKTGSIVLYTVDEHDRTISVLGIRHQREAGYRK